MRQEGFYFSVFWGLVWVMTSMVKKWWLFCVTIGHSARWLFPSQSSVPDFCVFSFYILAAVTQVQIWVFIVAREAFCAVALIPLPGRKGWLPQQIVPVSLQVRLEAHHSATEGVKQDEPRQKVVNVLYLWPLHTGDRIHCRWQIHMYILVLSSRSPGLPLWGCRVWQCLCDYCGSSWGCFATERVQPCSSPPCAWWLLWG